MLGLFIFFFEFGFVGGLVAAGFFEDARDGPEAAGLFLETAEARLAAGDDTEVVLFGDGLPKFLRLGGQDFAVGAKDEADAGSVETDFVDDREGVNLAIGDADFGAENEFETAAHFLIDLGLRGGQCAVVEAFAEVFNVGEEEGVVVFAVEVPGFGAEGFEGDLEFNGGAIRGDQVLEHLRLSEALDGVDGFGERTG